MHDLPSPENLEGVIEGEKCLNHILLIIEGVGPDNPLPRVFNGEKDVVEVYEHAWSYPWDNLKNFVLYVAREVQDMGRVDE